MRLASSLLLVLALALPGQTGAQSRAEERSVFLGFRIGHSSARQHFKEHWVPGEGLYSGTRWPALTGGVTLEVATRSWLWWSVDAQFIEKGAFEDPRNHRRLGYVEFPVLLGLALPLESALRPFVVGGPAPAWELGCGASESPAGGIFVLESALVAGTTTPFRGCITEERAMRDFGWTYGMGLQYRAPRHLVSLEVRRTMGTRDILLDPFQRLTNESRAVLVSLSQRWSK